MRVCSQKTTTTRDAASSVLSWAGCDISTVGDDMAADWREALLWCSKQVGTRTVACKI
jgi:hypothetical protein